MDKARLKNGKSFEAALFESGADTIGSFCSGFAGKKGFNVSSKILEGIFYYQPWMVESTNSEPGQVLF